MDRNIQNIPPPDPNGPPTEATGDSFEGTPPACSIPGLSKPAANEHSWMWNVATEITRKQNIATCAHLVMSFSPETTDYLLKAVVSIVPIPKAQRCLQFVITLIAARFIFTARPAYQVDPYTSYHYIPDRCHIFQYDYAHMAAFASVIGCRSTDMIAYKKFSAALSISLVLVLALGTFGTAYGLELYLGPDKDDAAKCPDSDRYVPDCDQDQYTYPGDQDSPYLGEEMVEGNNLPGQITLPDQTTTRDSEVSVGTTTTIRE